MKSCSEDAGEAHSKKEEQSDKGSEKQNPIMQHTVERSEGKVGGLSFRRALKGHNMPEQLGSETC